MLHRKIGISEVDGNNRDASRFCGIDIGPAIPDHDCPFAIAASPCDGFGEMARIRLAISKCVGSADCCKSFSFPMEVRSFTDKASNLFVQTANS